MAHASTETVTGNAVQAMAAIAVFSGPMVAAAARPGLLRQSGLRPAKPFSRLC